MKLFSYKVARDFGFAPNPFFGFCTLATCKPNIRKSAVAGDWVVGTGSRPNRLEGHLIYAMQVTEVISFDKYWRDGRFSAKRPYLQGSLKQLYGDNIYHRHQTTRSWIQADSHHSLDGGKPNKANIDRDTKSENVLISNNFSYFGSNAPKIPKSLRNHNGEDLCKDGPSHKCNFSLKMIENVLEWLRTLDKGYLGEPSQFRIVRK